jgi:hypothetical protein
MRCSALDLEAAPFGIAREVTRRKYRAAKD